MVFCIWSVDQLQSAGLGSNMPSIFVCVAMLPSLVLQHTSVRPYQRGLYCGDSSLSYPYQKSTVPSSVLTAVGLTLPFVSVSPAHKQGAHVSGNTEAEIGRVGGC